MLLLQCSQILSNFQHNNIVISNNHYCYTKISYNWIFGGCSLPVIFFGQAAPVHKHIAKCNTTESDMQNNTYDTRLFWCPFVRCPFAGAHLSWCPFVRCPFVLVPICPVPFCPGALLSWCPFVLVSICPGAREWPGPGFTQYFILCLEYIAK